MKWLTLLLLMVPLAAWGQNNETLPPACSVTSLVLGNCVPNIEGTRVRVTDGNDEDDCTLGAGSTVHVCEYNGSAWVDADPGDLPLTACVQVISGFLNPTEAGATDDYLNLVDNTISATDAAEDEFTLSMAAVVHDLRVDVDAAPGAGNDRWDITVMDDGVATLTTCNIDEAATSCTAATSSAIAAGSDMTVQVTSNAQGAAADPTAAADMRISFCLNPD